MATVYSIRSVVNLDTGAVYKVGIDFADDGTGLPAIIPGSNLETDYADGAGDSIMVNRQTHDN